MDPDPLTAKILELVLPVITEKVSKLAAESTKSITSATTHVPKTLSPLKVGKSQRKKGKGRRESPTRDNMLKGNVTFRARCSNAGTTVTTSAGGLIALSSIAADAARTGTGEFAEYAVVWSHFRVHSITLHFAPRWPSSFQSSGAVDLSHGALLLAPSWDSNEVYSSVANLLQNPACTWKSTSSTFTYKMTWKGYPDAHLYHEVGSAIPADQNMRIYFGSTTSLVASVPYYYVATVYDVEFRGII